MLCEAFQEQSSYSHYIQLNHQEVLLLQISKRRPLKLRNYINIGLLPGTGIIDDRNVLNSISISSMMKIL